MKVRIVAGVLVVLVASSVLAGPVAADQVTDLLDSAKAAYTDSRYSKALEDLNWAQKELLRLRNAQLLTFLPDTMTGYQAEDPSANETGFLGIGGVTREYRSEMGDGRVEIAVVTSQAGGQSNPMSALVGFAAMAANSGEGNSQLLTIGEYRGNAMVDPAHRDGHVVFGLGGNGMVKIDCSGCESVDVLKAFAEKIDFVGIEKTIK